MRRLTVEEHAAIRAGAVRPVVLVEADFADEQLLLAVAPHDVTWQGKTYMGAGRILSVTPPAEGLNGEVQSGEIVLNGLTPAAISLAMNEDIDGTPARVIYGLRDWDSGQPVGPGWRQCEAFLAEVRIGPSSDTALEGGSQ